MFSLLLICSYTAKLLLSLSLSELKSRTTFRGLNPVAAESVLAPYKV